MNSRLMSLRTSFRPLTPITIAATPNATSTTAATYPPISKNFLLRHSVPPCVRGLPALSGGRRPAASAPATTRVAGELRSGGRVPARLRRATGLRRHCTGVALAGTRGPRRHPPRREHAPSAPTAATPTRTPCSRSSARSRSESLYRRFHGFPSLDAGSVEPFLDPDWDERGALIGTLPATASERIVALGELRPAARPDVAPRSRSRSPTSCRAAASARACSSSSPRPPRRRDLELRRRGAAREPRDAAASSRTPASRSRARLDGGDDRGRLAIAADRDATGRAVDERDHVAVVASLRPFFSPAHGGRASAPRRGAARSAASSSATSSTAASPGPPTPSTRKASRSPACGATRRSRTFPAPVDLAVFCLPGEPCSPRPRRRSGGDAGALRDLGRLRRDRDRGRRRAGASCSRSCAPTARA